MIELLYSEFTLLKQQVAVLVAKQHYAVKDNWLRAALGRFKDDPEFDNIVRAGQAMRNEVDEPSQQPEQSP